MKLKDQSLIYIYFFRNAINQVTLPTTQDFPLVGSCSQFVSSGPELEVLAPTWAVRSSLETKVI